MALADVLDEERWPRPAGLQVRRAANEDELTIEVIDRSRVNLGDLAALGGSSLIIAASPWFMMVVAVPIAGVTLANLWRRATRGDVMLSVRADQLRWGPAGVIPFAAIRSIEAVGAIHRELWIRWGKDVAKHSGKTSHIDFLARWLTTVWHEAREARPRMLPP